MSSSNESAGGSQMKNKEGAQPGSNNFGGRKLSSEWNEVYKVDHNTFRCKWCKNTVSGKIVRIKTHLLKCGNYNNKQKRT